ncbi:MAG: hypothetical protein ACO4AI_15580 [Prochlorothrix sp.]|jgi:hypothetical protein
MAKSTKTRLQDWIDQNTDPSYHYRFQIEYRGPNGGYWAVPDESRYFGDRGEYLGGCYDVCIATLNHLL